MRRSRPALSPLPVRIRFHGEVEEHLSIHGSFELLPSEGADFFNAAAAGTDEHLAVAIMRRHDPGDDVEEAIVTLDDFVNVNGNGIGDLLLHAEEHLLSDEFGHPKFLGNISNASLLVESFPLGKDSEERINQEIEVAAFECRNIEFGDEAVPESFPASLMAGGETSKDEVVVLITIRPLSCGEVRFVVHEHLRRNGILHRCVDTVLLSADRACGIDDVNDSVNIRERLSCDLVELLRERIMFRLEDAWGVNEDDLPSRVIEDPANHVACCLRLRGGDGDFRPNERVQERRFPDV